ncbi:MAG: DUF4270 family protein [Bacteroidota bacterium]
MIIGILFSACDKDTDLGLEVQPESDRLFLQYTDTINIQSFTVSEDSLSSYSNSLNILGSYVDPVFGVANASFLTQVRLSSNNVVFDQQKDGSLAFDEIVLYLRVNDGYGNSSSNQNVSVYKLSSSIYKDSVYYSDIQTESYYQVTDLVGEISYSLAQSDTVLPIVLNTSFGESILFADTANFIDNDAFLNFLKGLYLKVEEVTSDGVITYFDLLSDQSYMTLKYHDSQGTYAFDFVINNNCARINAFNHDYSLTVFNANINNSSFQDSVLYLQGLGGVKTRILFPNINYWRSIQGIAINKAELFIPIETAENSLNSFTVPEKLTVRAIKSDMSSEMIIDDPYFNSNNNYFNGAYSSDEKAYRMNITRYFQYLLKGTYSDNGLYLFPNLTRVEANRVVINSGQHSNNMKLLITYTKL